MTIDTDQQISIPIPDGFLGQDPFEPDAESDVPYFTLELSGSGASDVAPPTGEDDGYAFEADITLDAAPAGATSISFDLSRPNVEYTDVEVRVVPETLEVFLGDTITVRG